MRSAHAQRSYAGPRDTYPVAMTAVERNEELHTKKSTSRTRAKTKAYSYVSVVGGKVATHKTWGECEARVRGVRARFKKATSPQEERAIIAEFSR